MVDVTEKKVNFAGIEAKWQKRWADKKIFEVKEDSKKKKYYVLDMFPYPSAAGLHIGHAFVFSLGDIFARFKRAQGYNVLYPAGYDALGLPAENAAIKEGTHPMKYTANSIKNFMKQQKAMGWSYDWSRLVNTSDSSYYRWDQWLFLKMLEKGIAYRKKSPVNWCPKCESVLANEQVVNGKCWRHEDTAVSIKPLEQWFFKITNYAEELLSGLEKLDWPERAKAMEANWIGKSEGSEILFDVGKEDISNCVIIHGSPSDKEKAMNSEKRTYNGHWIPWIKNNLEGRGIKTKTPLMPEPWEPKYEDWKKEFEKINIDENSVLIGHSAGGGFLVRWLGETGKKVKKLILVAPAIIHSGSYKRLDALLKFKINKKVKDNVKEIIIFVSDDDSEGVKKSVELFSESFGIEPIRFHGKGHFTLEDMGTDEFSELLDKIISSEKWPIFTTRPDTLFGVTFMVVSAQHPKLASLITNKQKKEVENFLKKIKSTSEKDIGDLEKEGVFTGSYARHPLTGESVPIWAGNFVVADYGAGMVMAVPAHDQRDFEFAKKYKIPMKVVVHPVDTKLSSNSMTEAYTGSGNLINSEAFDDLENIEAKEHITKALEAKKLGKKTIQYKLRDWLISRQRYWGTPIPVVYCEKCGIVPVPEKELPVELPEKVKFGLGNPLATNEKFVNTKCPKCKGKARRETDTMDTFVNSSWYYLRYCDPKNNKKIFDEKKAVYWTPIDQYIGGPEHITMHLIYVRFVAKFLRDLGLVKFDEPAKRYFTQGIVHASDGEKMSKSRGNVVDPIEMVSKYGADTLRMGLVSFASSDKDSSWDEKTVIGSHKFLNRVYEYFLKFKPSKVDKSVESKMNIAIKQITENVEGFKHNSAVIKLRELFDYFSEKGIDKENAFKFLKMLHVYCPHLSEEMWANLGGKGFVSLAEWPVVDEKKIDMKLEEAEKNVEKSVGDILNILKIVKEKEGRDGEKVYLYVIPNELGNYDAEALSKRTGKEVKVFAVNDKAKYDPQGKASKAKPGKPGIYVE